MVVVTIIAGFLVGQPYSYKSGTFHGSINAVKYQPPIGKIELAEPQEIPKALPRGIFNPPDSLIRDARPFPFGESKSQTTVISDKSGGSPPSLLNFFNLTDFEGITYTGSFPPDPDIAVGYHDIIVTVNASIAAFSKGGTLLFAQSLYDFFSSVNSIGFIYDPRIVYHPFAYPHGPDSIGRYILLALARDSLSSRFLIGIGGPRATDEWNLFSIDAALNEMTDTTDLWADFPGLGFDEDWVVLSANMYLRSPEIFVYSKVRVLDINQLLNGEITDWADFWAIQDWNATPVFTITPSVTYGTHTVQEVYLINTGFALPSPNFVTVWKIHDQPPVLSYHWTYNVGFFSDPPPAEQYGDTAHIDTGDDRISSGHVIVRKYADSLAYLYCTFAKKHNPGGGDRSFIKWLQLNLTNNSIEKNLTWGSYTNYLYYPTVTVDRVGDIIASFAFSGPNSYAGTKYSAWQYATGSPINPEWLRWGEGPYEIRDGSGRNRWGDYYDAEIDPVNMRDVWIFGEYATNNNSWSTWVGRVAYLPDLTYNQPSGWDYPVVPRNSSDATPNNVRLPDTLVGNDSTFLNYAWANIGNNEIWWNQVIDPSMRGSKILAYIDEPWAEFYEESNIDSMWMGQTQYKINVSPYQSFRIPGGRHTVGIVLDAYNTLEEENEYNNTWSQQFVWSPMPIYSDQNYFFSTVPSGGLAYPNCDGYMYYISPYWRWGGVAVFGHNTDYDLYLYDDYVNSTDGFDTWQERSADGPGQPDFILVNVLPGGPDVVRYFGVHATSYTSQGFYNLHANRSFYTLSPTPGTISGEADTFGTFTLHQDDIFDVYSVHITSPGTYFFKINLHNSIPSALALYHKDSTHVRKSEYMAVSLNGYYNGSFEVDIPDTGVYGFAFWRTDGSTMDTAVDYDIIIGYGPANLTHDTLPGWYDIIVPRDTNNTNSGYAPLSTHLIGNEPATYLNFSFRNVSSLATPAFHGRILLDNESFQDWAVGGLGPYQWAAGMNWGPYSIPGGRHTLSDSIDVLDEVWETDESDNYYAQQYVWSPLILSTEMSYLRPPAPEPISPGMVYYNCDGYSFNVSSSSIWGGVAILPRNSNDDYDLLKYWDYVNSTDGFDIWQVHSYGSPGESNFILVNRNAGAPDTNYFGTIRFSGGVDSFYVNGDQTTIFLYTTGTNAGDADTFGIYSIDATDVFDVFPVHVTQPGKYFFKALLYSTVDVGISLYHKDDWTVVKSGYMAISDTSGPGGDEYFEVDIADTGVYGFAIWKSDYTGAGLQVYYAIVVGLGPTNLTHNPLPGWSYAIVPRDTNDATLSYAPLPDSLPGNQNKTYINFSLQNTGLNNSPGFHGSIFLDDFPLIPWSISGLPSGFYAYGTNIGPVTVRGGRHTIGDSIDIYDDVWETDETDNYYERQFVWSPLTLTKNNPVARSEPPSYGNGVYPNSDGFRFSRTPSYAQAIGITPFSGYDDYDLRIYTDYSGSDSGFSILADWSAYPASYTDFVISTWDVGESTVYPAVMSYSSVSADSFAIEADDSYGHISYPPVLYSGQTLSPYEILNIYEFYLYADTTYMFHIQNLNPDTVDVRMYLFPITSGYYGRGDFIAFSNTSILTYTPSNSGWYPLAIAKTGSSELFANVTYDLAVEKVPIGTWVGNVSSDWHSAYNWAGLVIPTPSIDAYVPAWATYMPEITSGDAQCQNLTIESGASLIIGNVNLTVNGNLINNGTLIGPQSSNSITFYGDWIGNGTFNPSSNSYVYASGSTTQHVMESDTFANFIVAGGANVQFMDTTNLLKLLIYGTVQGGASNLVLNTHRLKIFNGGILNADSLYVNCEFYLMIKSGGVLTLKSNFAHLSTYALYNEGQIDASPSYAPVITVGGDWIDSTGTFLYGNSYVWVNGSLNRKFGPRNPMEFWNLSISLMDDTGDTLYIDSSLIVHNNLTVDQGILYLGELTHIVEGDVIIAGGGIDLANSWFTQMRVYGNWDCSGGIFEEGGLTIIQTPVVTFNGNTDATVVQGLGNHFGILVIDKSNITLSGNSKHIPGNSTSHSRFKNNAIEGIDSGNEPPKLLSNTISLNSDVRVDKRLVVENGSVLDLNGNTVYIAGTGMNSDTSLLINGTVSLDAPGDSLLNEGDSTVVYIDTSGVLSVNNGYVLIADQMLVDGLLEVAGGTIETNTYGNQGRLITRTGSWFTMSGGAINVNAILRVDNGSIWNVSGGDINIFGTDSANLLLSSPSVGVFNLTLGNGTLNKIINLYSPNGHILVANKVHVLSNAAVYFYGDTLQVGDTLLLEGLLHVDGSSFPSVLQMGNNSKILVMDGGRLSTVGTLTYPVTVTHLGSGRYYYEVYSGGWVSAENTIFEYMKPGGIRFRSGSNLDTTHAFANCTFRNGSSGGTSRLITFNNTQTVTIENAVFPDNTWGSTYNVYKSNAAGHITFLNATGLFAGEDFDYDPNNLVDWTVSFVAGDANGDGTVDDNDLVFLSTYLFHSGPAPTPLSAGDNNHDCEVTQDDIYYLADYLYYGGPAPSPCGTLLSNRSGFDKRNYRMNEKRRLNLRR